MSGLFFGRLALGVGLSLAASAATSDHLVHQWTFNDGTGNDSVGTAHGTLNGRAWIGNGALYLMGSSLTSNNDCMRTEPLGGALEDRTLVAWCALATPTKLNNCAGAVLSVGTNGNVADSYFDGIVFGERTPGQWMNGSDYWVRSPENNGGELETTAAPQEVMIAITYSKDPYQVTIYRNGKPYAAHSYLAEGRWRPDFPTLGANSVALFGPRNAGSGFISGLINEARVYDAALTAEEVAALYAEGPVKSPVTTPWNGSFETNSWTDATGLVNAQTDNFDVGFGWFSLDPALYDTKTGYARLGCGLSWCLPPTDGPTLLWVEAPSRADAGQLTTWTDQQKPFVESGYLGYIRAGEAYRVQVDVGSGPEANSNAIFNRPLVELVDGVNGDVLAFWSMHFPTPYTLANADFTSPVMTADRDGHPMYIRLSVRTQGIERQDPIKVQSSFDNVRVTVVPGATAPVADAVFTGTVTDLTVSDSSNWQGGVAPTGSVGTILFKNRGNEAQTTLNVDALLVASNLVFEQEGPRAVRQFLDTYTGRFALHDMGAGTPTVSVSDGFVILDSLTANDGFVKTGAGTLQLGGLVGDGATVEVREGRLSLGDDLAHRWSFNDGTGRDLVGLAHGTVAGEATYEDGMLYLPGGAGTSLGDFTTEEIGRWINNKTLVVWTRMKDPTIATKGSALSLCTTADRYCTFDGIVYAEITPQYWMAGSENYKRTQQSNQVGYPEEDAGTNLVMMAISYNLAWNQMHLSRNGAPYATNDVCYYNLGTVPHYGAHSHAIIGPRHYGNPDTYLGWVDEARIYRHDLSVAAMQELAAKGPNGCTVSSPTPPLPKDIAFKVAPGAVLDLNMMEYTARSFTGAGTIQNGLLHVTDQLTITGPLTVEDAFAIEPGATLAFASGAAALKVNGPLTLPAQAKLQIDLPETGVRQRKMTLFTSATPVDWNVLDNWDFAPPELPCYRFEEFKTDTEFGYNISFVGGTTVLIR